MSELIVQGATQSFDAKLVLLGNTGMREMALMDAESNRIDFKTLLQELEKHVSWCGIWRDYLDRPGARWARPS